MAKIGNNIETEIDFFNCGDFAIVKVVKFDHFKTDKK